MTVSNNPSLGYGICGNCRKGRASVHQQKSGSPFLYTRFCENPECTKKTCQKKDDETQRFMFENLEAEQGVEVKDPPFIYKAKKGAGEKPNKPSSHQGSEWSPEDMPEPENTAKPEEQKRNKPSGGLGLLLVALGGAAMIAMGAMQ